MLFLFLPAAGAPVPEHGFDDSIYESGVCSLLICICIYRYMYIMYMYIYIYIYVTL